MKFKFQFERLLHHRKREEELAMRDYLRARQTHDEGVRLLESFYHSIDDTRQMEAEVRQSGGKSSDSLRQMDDFIAGQEIRITRQKLHLRTLSQEMEEKHVIAVAKAQETKVLEKLREKLLARHQIGAKKKEVKEMDDLVTMRFRLRGGGL